MRSIDKIEQSNKEFLENMCIYCQRLYDGGWELKSYTDGNGEQIIHIDSLSKYELINYLKSFDVNDETLLWWSDGKPGPGVPFDNIRDLYDDIDKWRKWMLGVANQMQDY